MDKAVADFRSSVVGDYELDTEIVDQLCNLFRQNATPLLKPTKKSSEKSEKSDKADKADKAEKSDKASVATEKSVAKASAKAAKDEKASVATEKAPRKKSAYNLFVKEKMQDVGIKGIDHKDKMKRIAEMWQTCDKEMYTKMAAELGDVDTLTIVTSQ